MSQALLEIMEPQLLLREEKGLRKGLKEGLREGLREGLKKGIQGTVDVLRDLKHDDIEIRTIIKKKYNLSDEKMAEYL